MNARGFSHLVADHILPSVFQSGFQVEELLPGSCQFLSMCPTLLPALPELCIVLPALQLNRTCMHSD